MGYAARANDTAQAVKRGDLARRDRLLKPHFSRPEFRAQWRAFLDRLGKAHLPVDGDGE